MDSHYIHRWSPQRRHERLISLITSLDRRHRHLRAYGLVSLGVSCLMSFKENSNCDEIALDLNALCIEISKKATNNKRIKDFENFQNSIVNSIIMVNIYTLNIASERFFIHY